MKTKHIVFGDKEFHEFTQKELFHVQQSLECSLLIAKQLQLEVFDDDHEVFMKELKDLREKVTSYIKE